MWSEDESKKIGGQKHPILFHKYIYNFSWERNNANNDFTSEPRNVIQHFVLCTYNMALVFYQTKCLKIVFILYSANKERKSNGNICENMKWICFSPKTIHQLNEQSSTSFTPLAKRRRMEGINVELERKWYEWRQKLNVSMQNACLSEATIRLMMVCDGKYDNGGCYKSPIVNSVYPHRREEVIVI